MPSTSLAVAIVVAFLLSAAGGMAWLVADGVATGETRLPINRVTLQRRVSRAEEPVTFSVSIGIYAALTAGSAGLLAWGVMVVRRERPR